MTDALYGHDWVMAALGNNEYLLFGNAEISICRLLCGNFWCWCKILMAQMQFKLT